jgi:hypothetical protein
LAREVTSVTFDSVSIITLLISIYAQDAITADHIGAVGVASGRGTRVITLLAGLGVDYAITAH